MTSRLRCMDGGKLLESLVLLGTAREMGIRTAMDMAKIWDGIVWVVERVRYKIRIENTIWKYSQVLPVV